MNGIDDLRRTLDERANDVIAHDVTGRTAAVHHKISVARRRRRATGAVAALAVVAGVAGALVLPDGGGGSGPEPADRLVGVDVPTRMTALGYTYHYTEGIEGEDGNASVRLEAADEPRLVSWATSTDDNLVRVTEPIEGEPVARDSVDFRDWVYVPAGVDRTIRVSARTGEPGLAVYSLGDERPDGVTEGGVTFRDWMAGQGLLGAAVGEPGQAELTVPATADSAGTTLHYFCSGGPAEASVELYLGGDGPLAELGGCRDDVPIDGADARSASFSTQRGEDVTARVVVRDADGAVVEDPDIRIGVGVYLERWDPNTIDGSPDFVERHGHRWEGFDLNVCCVEPDGRLVRVPRGHGLVLAIVRADVRDATVVLGSDRSVRIEAGGSGSMDELLEPGDVTGFRVVDGEIDERDRFQVAFYRLAD